MLHMLKVYLAAPLQPQLEDIVVASALDDLVTGVKARVIDLVRHEQILGIHGVAAQEYTLKG